MRRLLALKREYLSELSTTELSAVAGGVSTGCLTGRYPSVHAPCPTLDTCVDVAPLPSLHRPCPTLDGCFTGTTTATTGTG